MKNSIILLILIALTYSCKKESNNPTSVGGSSNNSANATILTSHKWVQTHDYLDTTSYAGNHLNQLPLSTTYDDIVAYDTCELTTKIWFKPNGNWVTLKGINCSASIPDTSINYSWTLSNNNTKLTMNGSEFTVLELNNNYLKISDKNTYSNSNGGVLYYEYYVWVFEPAL